MFVLQRPAGERPLFYLIPRNHVAAYLWVGHRNWLANRGRGGKVRNDNSMRNVYASEIAPYRERWDALEHPTVAIDFGPPTWWEKAVTVVSEHHDRRERAALLGLEQGKVVSARPPHAVAGTDRGAVGGAPRCGVDIVR